MFSGSTLSKKESFIKWKNKVVTREQLDNAKKQHEKSYETFLKEKEDFINRTDLSGWTIESRIKLMLKEVKKPLTMRQCLGFPEIPQHLLIKRFKF